MTDSTKQTLREIQPWVALFVALPSALDRRCEELVAPLVVVRVGDVIEAMARMSKVRPLIVITSGDGESLELKVMRELCIDARGQFVRFPPTCSVSYAEVTVKSALSVALRRFM